MLVQGTIIITRGPAAADAVTKQTDKRNNAVIFKNCVPLIDCINEINNTQVDNTNDLNVVIPMHN